MGRERRANRKRSARQRAVSRYGYTPIGFAGPEDVPPGAFQPPPPPSECHAASRDRQASRAAEAQRRRTS